MSEKKQQERIAALQEEVHELQRKLGCVQCACAHVADDLYVLTGTRVCLHYRENEDAAKIVSRHIKLLHRYNEAKDAAQILIGRLAAHRQTTISQIHKDYGLTKDD
ncbi:hypothetical protein EVJ58_g3099 [Rhodofomes roseus]|uniref:DNA repair protein n=1 Tax=Rhodofomes roseus TaxID=34475 RepID=A0A4Y9YRL0_9APHY|nr:hypothetical protein EVJ58_g3099 [Rhodofomes roseus]